MAMDTTRPLIAVLDDELQFWARPFRELRAPIICNIRSNPFERDDYEGPRAMKYLDLHADIMRLRLT